MRLLDLELFGGLSVLIVSRNEVICVHRPPVNQRVLCEECIRTFSRESDKKRHKWWMKGENQLVSIKEQCSVPVVLNGLKVRMGGRAIHTCVPRH